jgi:hypothetical protein
MLEYFNLWIDAPRTKTIEDFQNLTSESESTSLKYIIFIYHTSLSVRFNTCLIEMFVGNISKCHRSTAKSGAYSYAHCSAKNKTECGTTVSTSIVAGPATGWHADQYRCSSGNRVTCGSVSLQLRQQGDMRISIVAAPAPEWPPHSHANISARNKHFSNLFADSKSAYIFT